MATIIKIKIATLIRHSKLFLSTIIQSIETRPSLLAQSLKIQEKMRRWSLEKSLKTMIANLESSIIDPSLSQTLSLQVRSIWFGKRNVVPEKEQLRKH